MIKLYGFGPNLGVMDASPFVVKVDAFLKMSGLEYTNSAGMKNMKKAPKGKLPYIAIAEHNKSVLVADSQAIIDYLTQKYQLSLDEHLTQAQSAQAYLMTKSLDENLYWCLVYCRWNLDETWPAINKAFFAKLPFWLSAFVPGIYRRKVKKALHAQGMGRHSYDEVADIADKTFAALATILADKAYFFGDKLSTFDATAYAFLCQFITVQCANKLNDKAKSYENLVGFCQRIEKQFYS
ncbi:glutathione S-transferase family protein [Colwelliaceae bacterium MEBiC 14330]